MEFVHGAFTVIDVMPNSPASEAGIKPGDTITAIDGRTADKIKPWEPTEIMRRDVGARLRLTVKSADGNVRDVTITLRELV